MLPADGDGRPFHAAGPSNLRKMLSFFIIGAAE
jgi:hypothetical protein